ncbi:uncharacterized protein F5891DRAFT_1187899 [Suillus fuscotomentosus]|uniref:Uncharacterized protein n=1 Tax=Suillus fuscotomentosus TaxID=1912939 RepID=A0AAD4EA68_9AGAM|nr:uncharacterized protein F5891DRAFT_1187899 [Suillus fuscotomentosus]KAG1901203.1 hypothetical protein F5891DRAFT_1187899 [Suillus fuscotomentosus]
MTSTKEGCFPSSYSGNHLIESLTSLPTNFLYPDSSHAAIATVARALASGAASESSNNDYDDSDDFKLSLDLAYGQSHDDRSSDWKALPYPSHDDRSQHSHIFPGAQGDLALANPTSFSNADLYTSNSHRESEPSFHSDSVAHQASLAGVPGLQTISDSFSMDRRQGQSQLYRQQEAQNYEDWVALSNSSRIWLPYNVPGSRSTFLGTQHLDPNKFYANCYSPQEPGPFQPYSDLVTHQAPSEPRVANSFSVDRSQSQQLQRQWDAQSHDDDRWEALLGRSQSTSGWSPYNISASGSHTSPGTQHLALADPTSFGADSHTSSSSREPGPSKSHSDSVTHQAPSGTPADRVSGVEIDTRLLTVPRLNVSLPLHRFHPYRRPGAVQASRDPILLDSNLEMDEIRDCLAMCCKSLYGIWDALGEMSEQDFIAFIADLLTGEKFLNGPIEVEGVMRNIPFGHVVNTIRVGMGLLGMLAQFHFCILRKVVCQTQIRNALANESRFINLVSTPEITHTMAVVELGFVTSPASVLASQKRQERAKEAAKAPGSLKRLAMTPLGSLATSSHSRSSSESKILPAYRMPLVTCSKPIAPCPSLWPDASRHQTLASKVPISHGTGAGQHSSTDDDRLELNALEADSVLEEPPCPQRRIPRDFEDIPLPDGDIDSSHNVDALPIRNPALPQSRIQRVLLTLRDALQTPFNSLEANSGILPPPYPFHNMTIYRLMSWMNSGSNKKSELEVARLVKEVLLAKDFDPMHLENFSVRGTLQKLDKDHSRNKVEFPDDWTHATVAIKIPTKSKEDDGRLFSIPGFHFRPLVDVIRSAFVDIQASAFHLSPFKRLWKDPLDGHEERIFDELYTSDSWLDAQDELQKLPREPGCALERVIAGLMFFSDATHLANFGTAKAWPLYMYFGNLTKYARSAPKSGACHLVGFLPSLPDKVKDIFRSLPRISKSGMAALHTHCRRELFHGCWEILLDKDFLHAYRHGIVLRCADGVLRRIFPRIFTYSADYPEKVLIATIKDMGSCPCPRCLTPKSMFTSLGLLSDMRSRISSLRVYVATNVIRAREFIYQGGNTVDGKKVEETLGGGSWAPILNKFVERLGALGLDTFQMLVVDLMHECELGTWKALFTHLIRILFCDFTCAVFDTVELPKEKAARQRRVAQRAGPNSIPSESSGPRVKVFNLSTYKFHAMGDYLRTIKLFGTTDSFTTQIGELAHRAIKAFYPLTSKVDTPAQLAKHEHRRRVLRRVAEAANISSNQQSPADSHASSLFQDHHFIADNHNDPVSLFTFLREHDGNPATKHFIPKLKDHLLYRLKKLDVTHCDRTFTDNEQNSLIIPNNTIYSIQTMQIHYTTYDMMREYDTISPRTHPDVMVLSGEASPSHSYWYARVLGIYRIDTWIEGVCRTKKHHLEVLYVRWLAPLISSDYESGIQHARLPKLVFVEESDHDAFGFLNPDQVIRGAHLIPAFASGRGVSSLRYGKSLARPKEELTDWEAYYVGIFVDQDMFLRYTSLGVGHPVALRKIIRNCFDLESATLATEDMDVDGSRSDSEDHGDDDEQRMDDGLGREESDDFEGIEIEGEDDEGEEDGEEGEEDEGEEGEGEEDEEEGDEREDFDDELDDELSF